MCPSKFLNQFDKNPLHVLQIVGLVFVELVLEDELLCYHILQLWKFSVQPVTSLLCFIVVISLILWAICTLRVQHELPRVFVSASFAFCRNVRMVLL